MTDAKAPLARSSTPGSTRPPIPGFTVRLVLDSLAETGGETHHAALSRAKLSRFIEKPPAPDLSPAASADELSALYAAALAELGDAGFRLFMGNYGRRLAERVMATEPGKKLLEAVKRAEPSARVDAAVRGIQALMTQHWATVELRRVPRGYVFEFVHCTVCGSISNVREPICASTEALWSGMLRSALGLRLTVKETACAAMGSPRCTFEIVSPG